MSEITPSTTAADAPFALAVDDPQVWIETEPRPWRRFCARMVDISINGGVTLFVFNLLLSLFVGDLFAPWRAMFNGLVGSIIDGVMACLAAVPLTAILIGTTGTSLGKWLMGIRVTDFDGKPLGVARAFVRELKVFAWGLGAGLPAISIWTAWSAYQDLSDHGETSWDGDDRIVYQRVGPLRWTFMALIIAAYVGLQLLSFGIRLMAGATSPVSS